MKIKMYCDPFTISGYSSALRDHIRAMTTAGIEVHIQPIKFGDSAIEPDKWWKEHLPKLLEPIGSKDYDITISYGLPDLHYHPEKGKYNIGYSYWEISRIPSFWVPHMNQMDAMWSACQFAIDVFKECGVTTDFATIPWPLAPEWFGSVDPLVFTPLQNDRFTFFGMGSFNERKNFRDLILAYCSEFENEAYSAKDGKGNTLLVLKTYINLLDPRLVEHVTKTVGALRDSVAVKRKATLVVVQDSVVKETLMQQMASIDSFVYTTKGEGMGGPAIQTMALGKPLIAPPHTSIADYHQGPFTVDFSWEPVNNMNHIPAYAEGGDWARLDVASLKKRMREAYTMYKDNPSEYANVGQQCANYVRTHLNYEKIGALIKSQLEGALSQG